MNYTVLQGQTIFDVALATYGDVSYVYQLIQDNPKLVNIDTVPENSLIVTWNPDLINNQPNQVASSTAVSPITSATYRAVAGQNIYDICNQLYGSLDKLYDLIQDSNFSNLLTYPKSGEVFIFNPTLNTNILLNTWVNKNGIIFTTGTTNYTVFSNEEETEIFESEDGSTIFTPEP